MWGAYHGLLMCIALLAGWDRRYNSVVGAGGWLKTSELYGMFLTFILVVFGWLYFRSSSLAEAEGFLSHMISHINITTITVGHRAAMYSFLLVLIDWTCRRREHVLQLNFGGLFQYRWGRWVLYYGLVFLIIYELHQSQQAFIYFQF